MVLILGGVGAGKTASARSLGYTDADFTTDVSDEKPVLVGLEALVRRDPDDADTLLLPLLQKELVLCCEVGSGVIPLERQDRIWRDATGRLCVRLAREASAVVRIVAGIPVMLKGELPCRLR